MDVKDSNNTNSTIIDPDDSTDSGNTTNWFPAATEDSDDSDTTTGGGGSDAQSKRWFSDEEEEIIVTITPLDRTWEYTGDPDGGAGVSEAEPRSAEDRSRGRSPAGDTHAPLRRTILSDDISTTRSLELQRALRRLARLERNERMEDRATEIVRRVLPQTPQVITQDMLRRAPLSRRHAAAPEDRLTWLIDILSSIKIGILDNFERTSIELANSFDETGATSTIVESSEVLITKLTGAPAKVVQRIIAETKLERVVDAITRNVGENMLARRSVKESSQLLTDTLLERGARTARKLTGLPDSAPEQDLIARRLYPTKIYRSDENDDKYVVEELRVALAGPEGIPYAHVPTTLFSTPKRSTTDKHGVAKFLNVLTGEHRLEARINNSFTLHKKITIEAPEGIDATPEKPVEVLIPMISITVEEATHGAAPGSEKRLKRQALIAGGLLGILLIQVLGLLVAVEWRRRNGSACAL